MCWKYICTEEDILEIQTLYDDFLDSVIVSFKLETGNYIKLDEEEGLIGYIYDNNNLYVIFQRLDENPTSIELVFEKVTRLNFYSTLNYCDILYAKFIKTENHIYWTEWKDFDPNNEEYLNEFKFTFIEAQKCKWRIID